VTAGSSLPVVQVGPGRQKVVHPRGSQRGSQAEPRRGNCQWFQERPRSTTRRRCYLPLSALEDGRLSKIIPRILRPAPSSPAAVRVRRLSPHRTDCCRSIRRREGVKGGLRVYVDQAL